MIKVRGAALPEDYRNLSPRALREALPSFLFFKAKDALPSDAPPPLAELSSDDPPPLVPDDPSESSSSWTLVSSHRTLRELAAAPPPTSPSGAVGLGGGGHRQQRGEVLAERVAPTARSATHNLLLSIAAFEGRHLRVGDIPSAYLQADHVPSNGRPVYIVADKYTTSLVAEAMPEYRRLIRPCGTMILKVAKAMYGLVESAWLWYNELERHLVGIGYSVCSNDRGLFFKKVFHNGKCVASNIASVHVDDIASAATPNPAGLKLEKEFWESMEAKWPGIKGQSGPHYKHLSWNIYQDPKTHEIHKSQRDYLLEIVKTSGVSKEHNLPSRMDLTNSDDTSPLLPPKGVSAFRSMLQKIAYAREGRPDIDFAVSFLQGKQSSPTEQDWNDLSHLLGYIKRFPEKKIIIKPKDMQLRGAADAAFNITNDGRSHYGYVITLGYTLVSTKGGRIETVVRSSTEAEISAVDEIASDILWCRDVLEKLGHHQDTIPIMEDNLSCITMLQKEPRNFHTKSRHVRVKWAFFREEYTKRTSVLWMLLAPISTTMYR